MKLIILYGAPAVGKLTIAQELAKISGIHVFDNHQVIDMIEPMVTRAYPHFAELVYQTQRNVIGAAVEADQTNVVLTFPYASNLDRDVEFITDLTKTSRSKGAEVYPVFLVCSNETLRQRAVEPSRKAYGKITTVDIMDAVIKKYDFGTPLAIEGNITINTDKISAKAAALQIKKAVKL